MVTRHLLSPHPAPPTPEGSPVLLFQSLPWAYRRALHTFRGLHSAWKARHLPVPLPGL